MGVQLPSEPITRKEKYLAKAAGQAVEIPAEPITREEAYLEAIANAGGGGGGTTNYNQLENKPQIAGTELKGNKSLADLGIASADDVKNEFIGTLAEWNALSPAQQKAYDTYQITDDYSEALMPNYSTIEQKTGQKWIDGKDIYFRTVELPNKLTLTSQQWTSTGISGADISTIINAFGNDANGTFFVFNATANVSNTGNFGFLQTRNVDIVINKFVLYYTKTE